MFPNVPLAWLLISVQFVEILWVLLNLLGVEHTWTDPDVNTVGDIHLGYMPYSHSLISSILFAVLVWFIVGKLYKYRIVAIAVAIGVFSHIVLDMLTHTRDISLFPFLLEQKIGVGLYAIPMAAFFVDWIVSAVAVQIVVTLVLIWRLAKPGSVALEKQAAWQRIRA